MICTKCRSPRSEVVNTRSTRGGSQIWRRRRCVDCGKVSTTYERQDLSFIQVVSSGHSDDTKNPQITPYRRSFLFSTIVKSIPDEQLSVIDVDNLVDTIEYKLLELGLETITTAQIREFTLITLKPVDMKTYMNYLITHLDFRTQSEVKAAIKHYS